MPLLSFLNLSIKFFLSINQLGQLVFSDYNQKLIMTRMIMKKEGVLSLKYPHFLNSFCWTERWRLIAEVVVQRCSVKRCSYKFRKIHRKTPVSESFSKVAGLRPALKKRLWHRSFLVNFVKFVRTPFHTEHLRRVLLFQLKFLVNW